MDRDLYILWSSDNIITAEKMVFLYAINSRLQNWWDEVTVIIWGASTQVANRNPKVQGLIKEAIEHGVKVSACTACADQLDATDKLEELGVELKYWGQPLTELLHANKKVITI